MILKTKKLTTILLISGMLILCGEAGAQEHNWNSHAEVARKVIDKFESLKTYSAHFDIKTEEGRNVKVRRGIIYFSNPGKIRFEFDRPAGDLIVSDGKFLWVYIQRLHAVGKQDLTLDVKDENGRSVFSDDPQLGISRLFRKYHYRFDTIQQPRKVDDETYFILDLDQREKIGGYEKIKLFIDPVTYLIRRAEASDSSGKKTTITYERIIENPPLEGKLFQYRPDDNVQVVLNPLVNE